jgi:hypothetical protein
VLLLQQCWDAAPHARPPALEIVRMVGNLDVLVSRPDNVLQVNRMETLLLFFSFSVSFCFCIFVFFTSTSVRFVYLIHSITFSEH